MLSRGQRILKMLEDKTSRGTLTGASTSSTRNSLFIVNEDQHFATAHETDRKKSYPEGKRLTQSSPRNKEDFGEDHISDFSNGSSDLFLPSEDNLDDSESISEHSNGSHTTTDDIGDILDSKEADVNVTEARTFVRCETAGVASHQLVDEKVEKVKKKIFDTKEKTYRKKERNPNQWKRNKAALARQRGESYTAQTGKLMPAKEPNLGTLCHENCKLKCNTKFDSSARRAIFKKYYSLDNNSKNALLFKSITIKDVARHRVNVKKQKKFSFIYSVTYNKQVSQVCKKALCAIYQFSQKKIELTQKKLKTGQSAPTPDKKGRHENRPHKIADNIVETIVEHIKLFPAESSHYSRHTNPHKMYLSPLLNITKMYNMYIEECRKKKLPESFMVKKCTYSNVFSRCFNLSFGHPESDTCSTCDSGHNSEEHTESYKAAFEHQRRDREVANTNTKVCYMTMDLQQTMPLPKLTTSKCFYIRQMWFYNFGVHTITPSGNKAYFFTWTEDVANRGSSEIISCLHTFTNLLKNEFNKNIEHLIIWSDSCSGQNKNFDIVCFYQYMIRKGWFKIIDHKFPEVGHSYLDSDRDFGRIEKILRKNEKIQIPDQYRDIIRSSGGKNSVVINMENRFRKVDTLASKLHLVNKKKNVLNEKVNFRDSIKWIRTEEYGSYLYKTSLDEFTPFQKVEILKSNAARNIIGDELTLDRVIGKSGSLSAEKLSNLRDQITYVDDEYKWFYEDICGVEKTNLKRRKTN